MTLQYTSGNATLVTSCGSQTKGWHIYTRLWGLASIQEEAENSSWMHHTAGTPWFCSVPQWGQGASRSHHEGQLGLMGGSGWVTWEMSRLQGQLKRCAGAVWGTRSCKGSWMWVTISVTACKGGTDLLSVSEIPKTGTAKGEGMGRKMREELEGSEPPKSTIPI